MRNDWLEHRAITFSLLIAETMRSVARSNAFGKGTLGGFNCLCRELGTDLRLWDAMHSFRAWIAYKHLNG